MYFVPLSLSVFDHILTLRRENMGWAEIHHPKVINKKLKKVEQSGGKWIFFAYFSFLYAKERSWPHL